MTNIGFIGLGTMGRLMAGHLLAAGHPMFVYSHSPPSPSLLAKGAVRCAHPNEVARRADTIFTMLPDTPDVDEVLFGPAGVAEALSAGKIVVDMSSISPVATKDFAHRIEAFGCFYLDAPVSGGEAGAKAASLTIMVGGSPKVFEAVRPMFECMGRTITLVGEHGAGQTAKVASQIIVALTIEAVAEALVFASKAGADPARVREALLGGFAASRVLEAHGERMVRRDVEGGFPIATHQKDLELALESARSLGVSLPNTASCQQLFNAALAAGGSKWDHSGLIRVLERLAHHEICT